MSVTTSWSSSPAIPATPAASSPWPSWTACATERFPYALQRLYRLEVLLDRLERARTEENARRAKEMLFGVQNSRKAREGFLAGLLDPRLMAQEGRRGREAPRRGRRPARPEGRSWRPGTTSPRPSGSSPATPSTHSLLEGGHGFSSTLFDIARTLLRPAEEKTKPNGERLREFRDSNRESLELDLFSEEPHLRRFRDAEADRQPDLADRRSWAIRTPWCRRSWPANLRAARAADLVVGTKREERAVAEEAAAPAPRPRWRRRSDPMIELARWWTPRRGGAQDHRNPGANSIARPTRKIARGPVRPRRDQHLPRRHLYAAPGLRSGQRLRRGRTARFRSRPPWPASTNAPPNTGTSRPSICPRAGPNRKHKLNLSTPFNFVTTADIIGGNSGSPVVNREGEFVGIIFDGNLQSLVLDFVYTEAQARALSVNSQGIIEGLRKVYGARELADELLTGKAR